MSKWQVGSTITVNDLMQHGYTYTLLEPAGTHFATKWVETSLVVLDFVSHFF